MPTKAMDLFDAYMRSALPPEAGLVASSFFCPRSGYAHYELVSYKRLISARAGEEGLRFQAEAEKLFVLVEPCDYPDKGLEPPLRSTAEKIPLRFSELESRVCKNQARLHWSKKALGLSGSFTIARPSGVDFSFCFFPAPEIRQTIAAFFEKLFAKESGIPKADAALAAAAICQKLAGLRQRPGA